MDIKITEENRKSSLPNQSTFSIGIGSIQNDQNQEQMKAQECCENPPSKNENIRLKCLINSIILPNIYCICVAFVKFFWCFWKIS